MWLLKCEFVGLFAGLVDRIDADFREVDGVSLVAVDDAVAIRASLKSDDQRIAAA
jgi:hypothetical protein